MTTIVEFKNEYAPEVSAVLSRTLRSSNSKDYPQDQIRKLCERFSPENIITDSGWRQMYVCFLEGTIVGTASITKRPVKHTNTYLVLGVFVDSCHQRKGIGRKLLHVIEKKAVALHAGILMAAVNRSAIDFYLRMGFEFREDIRKMNAKGHFVLQKKIDRQEFLV